MWQFLRVLNKRRPKPKGGLSPIAIGEVLRRLTGKALCAVVKEQAKTFFEPFQLGVACPGGCEASVHSARAWTRGAATGHTKGLVKLDFENAFNTVNRQAVLQEVFEWFPSLMRWCNWCYGQHSNLVFGDNPALPSQSGVQQGDPLGPLFFAAALQPLVKELHELRVDGKKLDLCNFYLDDGFLAGDLEVVTAALQLVSERGAQLGLQLNLGKCELVLPSGSATHNLEMLFPVRLLYDEHNQSRINSAGNFELLGAAVGTKEFCEEFASERVRSASKLLDLLPELGDAQVALRLLRSCAGACRLVHSARTTPPHLQTEAFKMFDDKVQDAFCKTTGLTPDYEQWQQATRSFRHCGLGLRQAALHAPAAYLSSLGATLNLCCQLDQGYCLNFNNAESDEALALATFNASLPPDRPLAPQAALEDGQKALSYLLDKTGHDERVASASMVDKATLLSEAEPGARAFWTAPPSFNLGLAVGSAVFSTEIRHRLCMQESAQDRWCPLCDCVYDTRGHHARSCMAGGDKALAHNAVWTFFLQTTQGLRLQPRVGKK